MEAGYEYNTDIHLEPAILEQMLNKSPLKHVSKVSRRCSGALFILLFNFLTAQLVTHMVVFVLQVKTPVLLMLGEDDKRVPSKQGIEYYRALKALQVPVR